MSFTRKVKPGECFYLKTGGAIVNKSSLSVVLVYLTEEELKQHPNMDMSEPQSKVENEETLYPNSK